jgi:thiosulfate/3-mercaptopyruvate sulfurtransferase
MKASAFFILMASVFMASLLFGGYVCTSTAAAGDRTIDPIVSTDWLNKNSGMKDLVILDIRSDKDYAAGHIPNSINAPFALPVSAWTVMKDDLLLEVPDDAELFKTLGSLGITPSAKVVVVTSPVPGQPPFYGLANATRVADTLIYAGVKNVAVLDGGYPKWAAGKLPTTQDASKPNPVTFNGKTNSGIFVSQDYVKKNLKTAKVIDGRNAEVYFGAAIEPFAPKPGHIPGATSLPVPWLWNLNEDGTYTYKDAATLEKMAAGVIRRQGKPVEVITYCGVGGYASTLWYVLNQVLGYDNVKIYDGAAQDWVRANEMLPYRWE